MKVATRAFAAYVLTFVVCTPVALANGLDLVAALRSSAIVASIACALVALLALGLENAEAKVTPVGWDSFSSSRSTWSG
jgi:hypothetical protein